MSNNHSLESIMRLCEETNSEVKRVLKLLEKFNLDKLDLPKEQSNSIVKKSLPKKSSEPIKKGNVIINIYNDHLLLTGDTFERKDSLKTKFNAKWYGPSKGWLVPKNYLNSITEFCKTYFMSSDTKTFHSNIDSSKNNNPDKNMFESDDDNITNDEFNDCIIDDD